MGTENANESDCQKNVAFRNTQYFYGVRRILKAFKYRCIVFSGNRMLELFSVNVYFDIYGHFRYIISEINRKAFKIRTKFNAAV